MKMVSKRVLRRVLKCPPDRAPMITHILVGKQKAGLFCVEGAEEVTEVLAGKDWRVPF